MLSVNGLSARYGMHHALSSVSLHVDGDEVVVILGANGAGKSTLLKSIAGNCEGVTEGEVLLHGQSLRAMDAFEIVEQGIAFVPEGRGIFGDLSVHENLLLGAYADHARSEQKQNLERVLALFPKLGERKSQIARTMSGGEQQMVAIGRALMSAPSILMLDEPSLGLSPLLCKELFQSLILVRDSGVGILLVEQNAKQSLGIADRGYLLENGKITGENTAANLLHDPAVQSAYLGGAGSESTSGPATAVSHGQGMGKAATEVVETQVAATRVPSDNDSATVSADSLLHEDISSLVARASSTASDANRRASALTQAQSTSATKLHNPRFVVPQSQNSSHENGSDSPKHVPVDAASMSNSPIAGTAYRQDQKIQDMLDEFETAARRAAGGPAPTVGTGTVSVVPSQDDAEVLPVIPVYRKDPVTVYKRDSSGKLLLQEKD